MFSEPRTDALLSWNVDVNSNKILPSIEVLTSRLEILEEILKLHNPLYVLLQEAEDESFSYLLQKMGYETIIRGGLITAVLKSSNICIYEIEANRRILVCEMYYEDSRFILSNVHLSSGFTPGATLKKRQDQARIIIRNTILNYRSVYKDDTRNEIIAGDFNLEPYEDVFSDEAGFFANRFKSYHFRDRKKDLHPSIPLINIVWPLFRYFNNIQGTLFFQAEDKGPWLIPDQILVSEDLFYDKEDNIQIISELQSGKKLTEGKHSEPNRIVGSDHLPIIGQIYDILSDKKLVVTLTGF